MKSKNVFHQQSLPGSLVIVRDLVSFRGSFLVKSNLECWTCSLYVLKPEKLCPKIWATVFGQLRPFWVISPFVIVKGRNNCNMKIAVHMSELSQLTELNNLSNSETPNLATHYRLASTESYSSIYCGKRQLIWQQFFIYGITRSCIY